MECLHIKNIKDTLYPFSVVNKTFHTAYACELNHKQIWNKCDVNYEMIMCLQKCLNVLVGLSLPLGPVSQYFTCIIEQSFIHILLYWASSIQNLI